MRIEDDPPANERMNKYTKRRKRHRANSIVKRGKASVRAHRRKTGRTGSIMEKRNHPKRVIYRRVRPNPPGPNGMNLGED
jgi:hypothetical protein